MKQRGHDHGFGLSAVNHFYLSPILYFIFLLIKKINGHDLRLNKISGLYKYDNNNNNMKL